MYWAFTPKTTTSSHMYYNVMLESTNTAFLVRANCTLCRFYNIGNRSAILGKLSNFNYTDSGGVMDERRWVESPVTQSTQNLSRLSRSI